MNSILCNTHATTIFIAYHISNSRKTTQGGRFSHVKTDFNFSIIISQKSCGRSQKSQREVVWYGAAVQWDVTGTRVACPALIGPGCPHPTCQFLHYFLFKLSQIFSSNQQIEILASKIIFSHQLNVIPSYVQQGKFHTNTKQVNQKMKSLGLIGVLLVHTGDPVETPPKGNS